jgi:hypothetical protein
MNRSQQKRTVIVLLYSSIFLSALHCLSSFAQSACRDPDVARSFGSVAYAAEADETIQNLGHSFFLITTSKGTRIVTDPLGPGWYPTANVVGDVVTVGKETYNHNAVQIILGNPLVAYGPQKLRSRLEQGDHELQGHLRL